MKYKTHQENVSAQDRRLVTERARKYLGTARVRIEKLKLPIGELRDSVLQKLKGVFREGGCRPLDAQNHVLATISQACLDDALRISNISADELLNPENREYPVLKISDNMKLDCLQGLHRLQAAKDIMPWKDQWWAVDLYLSGKSEIPYRDVIH
jgi:hypothetical protein